tara:strand:+ start:203 stop:1009 length:807 start_codon:yes stop_codon:yes gene_type:complete
VSKRIGFIGAGQMASALASGFAAADESIAPEVISFFDPAESSRQRFSNRVAGAQALESAESVIAESDIIFLAVKPQIMPVVLPPIAEAIDENVLVVSIAAGVSLATISTMLGSTRIIRVMPNTPCLVGTSAAVYSPAEGATQSDCDELGQLLNSTGIAYQLAESYLDAVTGLSGSGPAYVYNIIEALSDGGVAMGLPRDIATRLAAQTVKGAAEMVLETGLHPGTLKDQVTSPGGTTIAGLRAMQDRGVSGAMMAAVEAATKRSRELG